MIDAIMQYYYAKSVKRREMRGDSPSNNGVKASSEPRQTGRRRSFIMSGDIASILATLAATYATNDTDPSTNGTRPKVVSSIVKPAKVAKVKAAKSAATGEQAAPKNAAPAVLPPNLPMKGTYDGRAFLMVLRSAGMRSREVTNEVTGEVSQQQFHDPSLTREDTIKAIAGYVGYDAAGDFGEQDQEARAKAQRELKPVVPQEYKRTLVAPTIAGYVAGMPNVSVKSAVNLEARERLAAAAMAAFEKVNDAPSFEKAIRDHFTGEAASIGALVAAVKQDPSKASAIAGELAAVEQERIRQIRTDLRAINL